MKTAQLVLGSLALTSLLAAQRAPEPPITATLQPSAGVFPLAPQPSTPPAAESARNATRSPRLSPETAARISAANPRFSTAKSNPTPFEEQPDLREIDKPRNGIIRLPQVMVQDQKTPVLKERDLVTPEGKLRDAYRRRPGLRIGSLPFLSNNSVALQMREEDLRLERMAESLELLGLYRYSNPHAPAPTAEVIPLFLRSDSWLTHGGSHAASRQR